MSTIYQRRLEKLGIATVGDLLLHSPRRHEDLAEISPVRQLQAGGSYTIRARVDKASMRHVQGDLRRTVTEALLVDESGDSVKALWFNARWVVRDLVPGSEFIFSGPVKRGRGNYGVAMMAPDYERGEGGIHTARLVPVYPETRGVSSKWLRRRIKDALPAAGRMSDDVPEAIAAAHGLPPFSKAIHDNHFPGSGADAAAAQRRLAFGQLLANQLEVQLRRQRRLEHAAPPIPYDVDEAVRARDALPFQLTEGQRRAAHQVFKDMDSDRPMARLVLGDVGSGKTVVAAMAATMAAKAGRQTLLMAPTELLARQHARSLEQLGPLGLRVGLLVGSSRAAERRSVLGDLAGGDIDLLVGTHALIEESVQPAALGLVIHDEQQRFGAGQRLALEKAGFFPHVLSMSATPIPRTLQLTALGDLDISVINERPPGVPPVTTQVVLPDNRDEAYDLVRRQVAEGNQAFVICPLVEDSVALQVRSATTEHSRLQSEVFPELRVALLHGRMKPGDKDDVMQAFKGREYDILVSTAVVEVGVDVPRATVILVEGAERFGLAQLHQFRGRMYRGDQQSYCLLLSDAGSPEDNQRLQAMERFDNGFDLAEEDLRLRGPGDIFGQGMQHGAGDDLLVAGLRDVQLIAAAQADARRLLEEGIDHHPGLARRLRDSGATWAVS